jgi:hypothetical protein
MTLDPQARAYLDRQATLGLRPVTELTPEEARQQAEAGTPVIFGPVEDVFAVSDEAVAGVLGRRGRHRPGRLAAAGAVAGRGGAGARRRM